MFVEHIVGALIQGKPASEGVAEIANKGWYQVMAWGVMMIAAFLPFFAVREIERAIGVEKIRGMFVQTHREARSASGDNAEAMKPKP